MHRGGTGRQRVPTAAEGYAPGRYRAGKGSDRGGQLCTGAVPNGQRDPAAADSHAPGGTGRQRDRAAAEGNAPGRYRTGKGFRPRRKAMRRGGTGRAKGSGRGGKPCAGAEPDAWGLRGLGPRASMRPGKGESAEGRRVASAAPGARGRLWCRVGLPRVDTFSTQLPRALSTTVATGGWAAQRHLHSLDRMP
jgi:hypothetical protein